MSLPDEDRELQRLLDGDGGETARLYRKLSRVEPPRRLDRNVLGEAARAVHGHAPRRHRWLVGFSSAAGIVLAAGVAWHVGQDALHQPEPSAFRTTPSAAQQRVYVPVHPFESAPARSEHEAKDSAATSAAAAAPAEPARELAPAVTKTTTVRARAQDARPQAAPAQAPAPAAPPPLPPAPAVAAAPEPAPASAPASAAQAAPAADAMKLESRGAVRQNLRSSESADSLDAAPAKQESAASTPDSLKRSAEIRNDSKLAPDAWIRRIQWLLEQGRDVQARESLNLLRRMHPDVELPDDLKSLQ